MTAVVWLCSEAAANWERRTAMKARRCCRPHDRLHGSSPAVSSKLEIQLMHYRNHSQSPTFAQPGRPPPPPPPGLAVEVALTLDPRSAGDT